MIVAGLLIVTILIQQKGSGIGSAFGGIPQGLPAFKIPDMSLDRIIELKLL